MASSNGGHRRPRGEDEGGSVLEGSWLWIALPVGVLALVAALWYLVIAPGNGTPPVTATSPAGEEATLTPVSMNAPVATLTPLPAATDVPATVAPTDTPKPTTVQVGARVQVSDTGAAGLRIRQAPSTDSVTLKFLADGTQLTVVEGPQQAGDITWWKVDDGQGLVGWAAGQFLTLVP